uniref:SH2 domain-containing protein n=1 Tax=Heterorhabditis bacteriophora TaxID=37862 RepID=A0A1I7WG10_HETBA
MGANDAETFFPVPASGAADAELDREYDCDNEEKFRFLVAEGNHRLHALSQFKRSELRKVLGGVSESGAVRRGVQSAGGQRHRLHCLVPTNTGHPRAPPDGELVHRHHPGHYLIRLNSHPLPLFFAYRKGYLWRIAASPEGLRRYLEQLNFQLVAFIVVVKASFDDQQRDGPRHQFEALRVSPEASEWSAMELGTIALSCSQVQLGLASLGEKPFASHQVPMRCRLSSPYTSLALRRRERAYTNLNVCCNPPIHHSSVEEGAESLSLRREKLLISVYILTFFFRIYILIKIASKYA